MITSICFIYLGMMSILLSTQRIEESISSEVGRLRIAFGISSVLFFMMAVINYKL